MRTQGRTKQEVGRLERGNPIAHRFTDGVFERRAAGIDGDDFRAKQSHAENVQRLPPHVFRTHVDAALHSKQRADSGGSHAVLTGTGLGDAALAPRKFGSNKY